VASGRIVNGFSGGFIAHQICMRDSMGMVVRSLFLGVPFILGAILTILMRELFQSKRPEDFVYFGLRTSVYVGCAIFRSFRFLFCESG